MQSSALQIQRRLRNDQIIFNGVDSNKVQEDFKYQGFLTSKIYKPEFNLTFYIVFFLLVDQREY